MYDPLASLLSRYHRHRQCVLTNTTAVLMHTHTHTHNNNAVSERLGEGWVTTLSLQHGETWRVVNLGKHRVCVCTVYVTIFNSFSGHN